MSMSTLISRFRNDQTGALPETILGLMANATSILAATGLALTSLVSFGVIQARAEVSEQTADVHSAVRQDIRWASSITPQGEKSFTSVVPGVGQKCRVSTWELNDSNELVNTVVMYPGINRTATPIACEGTAQDTIRRVYMRSLDGDTGIRYFNAGGRTVAPNGDLAPEVRPEHVPQRSWDATWIVGVDVTLQRSDTADDANSALRGMSEPMRVRQTSQNIDTHTAPDKETVFLDHARLSPDENVVV